MTEDKTQVVISMTSFPAAIGYAEQAVQYLLNGSVLPDKLVLYLTFSQFEGQERLLDGVKQLAKDSPIFEVRDYPTDIRSYRKLVPALHDFPEAIIVTVDDDVAYYRHTLRDLLCLHAQYPDAVLAHRAKRIKPGKPYRQWKKYHWYDFVFKRIHCGFLNLQTGVAGVLYPPHALKADMMKEELFTRISPTADDIWFWAAGVAQGTPVIPVPFGQNKPRGLGKPKTMALKTVNFKAGTDRNLAAFNAILEQFPEIRKKIEGYKGK